MAGVSERLSLHRARRPNVVWVFGDQHRAHATSYRGDGNVFTPNIDNLAREGMRFDGAVAGAPWCTPFRGALLTGRYPHQSGVVANGCRLDPELPTVAHAFAGAGYHTAYVGKWHLDGTNDRDHYVPPGRRGGFHYWMGNEASNNQHEYYAFGTDSETPVTAAGVRDRCMERSADRASARPRRRLGTRPRWRHAGINPRHVVATLAGAVWHLRLAGNS